VPSAASRRVGAEREPSLTALSAQLLRGARSLAADYALLAALDARRATVSLAWLLSIALMVAVLAVTAWLALVTGAIVWLLGAGMSWPMALGTAALVNVIAAIVLGVRLRRLYMELPFAATLRQLKGEPLATEEDE
jgi:ABC-type transport system involved in multi-copper enzyme maturation permease subunit